MFSYCIFMCSNSHFSNSGISFFLGNTLPTTRARIWLFTFTYTIDEYIIISNPVCTKVIIILCITRTVKNLTTILHFHHGNVIFSKPPRPVRMKQTTCFKRFFHINRTFCHGILQTSPCTNVHWVITVIQFSNQATDLSFIPFNICINVRVVCVTSPAFTYKSTRPPSWITNTCNITNKRNITHIGFIQFIDHTSNIIVTYYVTCHFNIFNRWLFKHITKRCCLISPRHVDIDIT